MKVLYPDIYDDFHCIGSDCKDNCCKIGWDIEIDNDTLAFYKSLNDDMGKRLCNAIYEEDGSHYMGQEGGCPFLNENGLCSVLLKYGEDKISEICANHPRFYEWFGDYKEAGVGLPCEEASRLLVEHSSPIEFFTTQTDEPADTLEYNKVLFDSVKQARDNLIKLMQDRSLPVSEKLYAVLHIAVDMQNCLDDENDDDLDEISDYITDKNYIKKIISSGKANCTQSDKKKIYCGIIDYFTELDYLHKDYPNWLDKAENQIDLIIENEKLFDKYFESRQYQYENLGVYYIYRYLLKSTRDYDGLSKLFFGVISVLVIRLLDISEFSQTGQLESGMQILFIKEYAKEIEYSADNVERIFDDIYSDSRFALDNLRKLLM